MNTAIIAAAGIGKRMKKTEGKQFLNINGKPMLAYSLEAFQLAETIEKIVLVVNESDKERADKLSKELSIDKLHKVIPGGERRQDSVFAGLSNCPPETKTIAIHDGARPMITSEFIDNIVNGLEGDGIVPGIPVKDTIKKVANDIVETTFNRNELIAAQTPQVFVFESITEAHNISRSFDFYTTDDAALMEKQKYKIEVIKGDEDNIKVTTPLDLELAELILKRRIS